MTIIVNDVAAETSGALEILKSFYEYVSNNEPEHQWIFLVSSDYISEKNNVKVVVYSNVKRNYFYRLRYDLFEGKKLEELYKPDLFLSLQNIGFGRIKTKQIVYVHQSIPFQTIKKFSPFKKDERKLWLYQNIIGKIIISSIKKAEKVIVQTEWIKKGIIKSSKVDEKKFIVVPPNIEEDMFDGIPQWNKKNFFLPISMLPYKNYDCVKKACKLLGGIDFNILSTTDYNEEDTRICNCGYISKKEMWANYHNRSVIFPSYIEAYGLPLAEARRAGSLVLASDCPFSREVLSGYDNAYFFNPFDPFELAKLIKDVVDGKISLKETKEESSENLFGWKDVVRVMTETKS